MGSSASGCARARPGSAEVAARGSRFPATRPTSPAGEPPPPQTRAHPAQAALAVSAGRRASTTESLARRARTHARARACRQTAARPRAPALSHRLRASYPTRPRLPPPIPARAPPPPPRPTAHDAADADANDDHSSEKMLAPPTRQAPTKHRATRASRARTGDLLVRFRR